jgi:hypothetical protein
MSAFDAGSSTDYLREGVVASGLGGLAGFARILLDPEKVSPGWIVRRVLFASILGFFVSIGLEGSGYITSPGLRGSVVGVICLFGSEILDAGTRWIRARLSREVEKVEKPRRKGARKSPRKTRG